MTHAPFRLAALVAAVLAAGSAQAAETVRIAWSHYTGWEPWGWIQDKGLAQKQIERTCGAGSKVTIELINDYIESINLYTAGTYQGVTATNMDTLTIPAVGGVASEMLIVGDTSHGNDQIITNDPSVKKVADLKGKTIHLVELSVSHYMLARALDGAGLSEKDITITNMSDADIGSFFLSQQNATVTTWNPIALSIRNANPKAVKLFDSAAVDGEIIDALVVRADLADCAKQALRAAWFEAMALLEKKDEAMIAFLADQAGGSKEEFLAQMQTTKFFFTPEAADAFVTSPRLKETMDYVRQFSFDHGLFQGKAVDEIGIAFPDGFVMGNAKNVMMRFTAHK